MPSSETKQAPPEQGSPVALGGLSFPALTPMRRRVLDALLTTSAGPDAFDRLVVGPSLAGEVERNTHLRELPVRPALEVYTGTLHGGLDATTLSPAARARAASAVVLGSALWGLLRPGDGIPPYRLNICSRLVGVERLEPAWRTVMPAVLAEAAGSRGAILDLRASSYQAMGMPVGMGDRTVTLRVEGDGAAGGRIGNVFVKRVRGQAARHLLESGADPETPDALAEVLGARWPVRLQQPVRRGGPWSLTVYLSV